jgi:hypothetical protein
MATVNNNIYEQVYNISEDNTLTSKVAAVICLLVERGVLVAGFSSKKELLILHFTGYNKTRPVWELNFFEHLFAHESLLADKQKVKGLFILGSRNIVVPDELYEKAGAETWLRNIHFIEQSDVIQHYQIKEAKANYLLALPVNITELLKINFKNAKTVPLAYPCFKKSNSQGVVVQLCVCPGQVSATMHGNGLLLWHKVFDFASAEDIAYAIMQVCREHEIAQSSVSLKCNALNAAEFTFINGLSQYFTNITAGDGTSFNTSWDAAITLARQLYSCV